MTTRTGRRVGATAAGWPSLSPHPQETTMTYACRDCDTTFTAPTDTDTVRCPGCGDMVEQQPAESSPPPDQALRDRIAKTLAATELKPPWPHCLAVADAIMPVLHGLTLRELELLARPNTPPSRPEPRIPDHTVNEAEAPAPVRQRADCTELEWAEQERARFERLYTRETVRADLAEQRAETAARDADIYQQRLERLGEGYTRERKRADEAEAHRLALSEALGLGTGAPWDAIHDRATELGLPPLTEDPVAQRLGLVPPPAARAAVLNAAAQHLYTALFPAVYADMGQKAAEGVNRAVTELRRLAAEAQQSEPGPVARVRALHQPDGNGECQHCHHSAPCPTITALDGAEAQQQPDTQTLTAEELAHALDNSTPYPIELDGDLCRFMAKRLLEMTAIRKRPEHAMWQPDEEPPAVPVQPTTADTGEEA